MTPRRRDRRLGHGSMAVLDPILSLMVLPARDGRE